MIGALFTCNVCGTNNEFRPVGDWREAQSCDSCGSSVRIRQVVHCLTAGLLGMSQPLPSIERSAFRGIGLSDPSLLAERLAERFAYTNTFYHQEPKLDICSGATEWEGADFLISSDVFEHVDQPVQRAFDGTARLLKEGGLLVLTVPFDARPETREHFPPLAEHRLEQVGDEWTLVGRTIDGETRRFNDLLFHGGPGSTLEMRFFARSAVIMHLEAAGFEHITVHDETVPEWGIFPPHDQGLPISARQRGPAEERAAGGNSGVVRFLPRWLRRMR